MHFLGIVGSPMIGNLGQRCEFYFELSINGQVWKFALEVEMLFDIGQIFKQALTTLLILEKKCDNKQTCWF